ncbi:hypothetical protein M3A49_38240 [Paraburkholderia sp. CNPSo 3076]|uniref:hypothetical protein n=1 Tax=Paraburkholderia sp. CNPSo 3076 TaxID=2940936 RepID=UPI00225147C7|nr:hypothetical protein [Paraburkholderia sp. CNPSo 3076]MCX5545220.1 hypothetical protein [Paraburkholderia sp. CNPSo 3076]
MTRASRSKDKTGYFLGYLGYLGKASEALISQAKRLQLLSNAALCSVAGGATGAILAIVYLHAHDFGQFDATVIGAFAPVLLSAVGLFIGRYIPVRAGMVRLDDENRITQKLSDNRAEIARLSAELDALPVQKGTTARRAALTLQIEDALIRGQDLSQKLKRLEDESLGEVFMPRADYRPRTLELGNATKEPVEAPLRMDPNEEVGVQGGNPSGRPTNSPSAAARA